MPQHIVPPPADAAAHDFRDGPPGLLTEAIPGIVHDLRNVLHVMVNGAAAARRGSSQASDGMLHAVEAAGRTASELTETLLRLSRAESLESVHDRHATEIEVSERLLSLQPLLRRMLPRSVALHLRCHPGLPRVRVDAASLDAAVLNLVANARDALVARTDAGRAVEVVIRTHMAWHDAADRQGRVCISVADTGCGMDSDILARLGEPYFTTKGPRGTGLGVHQVRQFARSEGGEFRIRSAVGCGTICELRLPHVGSTQPQPAKAEE